MKLSKQEYEDIIMVLRGVIDGTLRTEHYGLCDTIYNECRNPRIIDLVSPSWSKYSGNMEYPVPCPKGWCPETCYAENYDNETMYVGEYGKLRLELAQFIIDHCEQRIKELENEA